MKRPTSTALFAIADTIGHSLRNNVIPYPLTVVTPLGMEIPLLMTFSHAAGNGRDYHLISWKIRGDLYVTVAFAGNSATRGVTTVFVMDKAKSKIVRGKPEQFASMVQAADMKGALHSVADYAKLMEHVIVGTWTRTGDKGSFNKAG